MIAPASSVTRAAAGLALCVVLLVLSASVRSARAETARIPTIEHPVTDLANVLGADATELIAGELVAHQAATGVQLAVLIVDTTGGPPIEDYAQKVFEQWGGGSAERNDGALFVLAIADRRNRLHLGYGLEPVIPDASAKRMLDDLRPHLRAANYAAATRQLVASFRARTEHLSPGGPRRPPLGAYPWMWIVIVLLGLVAGIGWSVMFQKGLAAWRKRPKPPHGSPSGLPVIDFFRFRPVQLTVAALAVVNLVLCYVFRHGNGYASAYSLAYWAFIPIGWIVHGTSNLVRITTGLGAVTFLSIGVAYHDHIKFGVIDWVGTFWFTWPVLLFVVALLHAAITGTLGAGGGGGSYSSSSSRSSSSSSSRSSSSSSSSSSRSYSGGGGRSGGGGASSSW